MNNVNTVKNDRPSLETGRENKRYSLLTSTSFKVITGRKLLKYSYIVLIFPFQTCPIKSTGVIKAN